MTSTAADSHVALAGTDPARVVVGFFDQLRAGDVAAAFAAVSPTARVVLHAAGRRGGPLVAYEFWMQALTAFPDLLLHPIRTSVFSDGRVLVELVFEGTQAADFLDAINQEKHLDVEQAWLLAVTDGQITAITAYWDQNKLYRRLAVKRLDQIPIA